MLTVSTKSQAGDLFYVRPPSDELETGLTRLLVSGEPYGPCDPYAFCVSVIRGVDGEKLMVPCGEPISALPCGPYA